METVAAGCNKCGNLWRMPTPEILRGLARGSYSPPSTDGCPKCEPEKVNNG